MRYRICVINDFRHSHAVLDYKEFGVIKDTQAWIHVDPQPPKTRASDSIMIFLNYDVVLDTKFKDKAIAKVLELLEKCPPHATSESEILFRAING